MVKDHGVSTGMRLPRPHFEKLNRMAAALNVSRNKMVALLIDGAEIEQEPVLSVGLGKNNRRAASDLTGQSSTAIGA